MSIPTDPSVIVIKNEFYPNGLTEEHIWKYYQSVKSLILREVKDRDLMFYFFISPPPNKYIIKRRTDSEFYRLTPDNYDTLISGRSVSVHCAMRQIEDQAIIDIDTPNFNEAKEAAAETYDFIISKMPLVRSATIQYTGKNGFHIFCKLLKKTNIDAIKLIFRKELNASELSKKYAIDYKGRTPIDKPILDLAPNKYRGNYISLYSLSSIGLRCMEVSRSHVLSFNKKEAIMKFNF